MTLACNEGQNEHYLQVQNESFCATTPSSSTYSAICQHHIQQIPLHSRSKEHIPNGLSIHYLHSTPNRPLPGENNLSLRNAQLGDFKFSISAEDAHKYLPNSAKMHLN